MNIENRIFRSFETLTDAETVKSLLTSLNFTNVDIEMTDKRWFRVWFSTPNQS